MKLIYCSSISYPSQYANRIQTLSTAQALSLRLGEAFILAARAVGTNTLYTGALENFHARRSFALAWRQMLFIRRTGCTHVYSREYPLLFALMAYNRLFFRLPLAFFFEEHVPHSGWRFDYVMRHARHVFCLTRNLERTFAERYPHAAMSVVPDGVRLEDFETPLPGRREAGLPGGGRIVSYVGSVGVHAWKGVNVFLDSLGHMPHEELIAVVAGVREGDEPALRAQWPDARIRLMPWLTRTQVADVMRLSDVLVLPNTTGNANSERFTSPLKLFEYMASGVPIVASDLPSIREVLTDGADAVLVQPDDPAALARGIDRLLSDPALASAVSARAHDEARGYSWDARAAKIVSAMLAP